MSQNRTLIQPEVHCSLNYCLKCILYFAETQQNDDDGSFFESNPYAFLGIGAGASILVVVVIVVVIVGSKRRNK